MDEVRWEAYPTVAQSETARAWLQIQAHLCLAPKTIEAYGRSLEDYLAFCVQQDIAPESAQREHIAAYVHDLATRPHPHHLKIVHLHSGTGLANATMQLRLTAVRLYNHYLTEKHLRPDNPVGRGRYTPGRGFGGLRDRALLPRMRRLPWIPTDLQWHAILAALAAEPLRNRLMLLLAYEGALRRGELVALTIGDLDVAYRSVRIRAEIAKNGGERVVFYSEPTSQLLVTYLQWRRALNPQPGALFLSTSHRNHAMPLSPVMWSKIVAAVAARAGVPQFTPHTLRHLRLTHMARAGLVLNEFASVAGHGSPQTTLLYIHLSGTDLAARVAQSMSNLDRWIAAVVTAEGL
jgi:site-specific recombinase XerD